MGTPGTRIPRLIGGGAAGFSLVGEVCASDGHSRHGGALGILHDTRDSSAKLRRDIGAHRQQRKQANERLDIATLLA